MTLAPPETSFISAELLAFVGPDILVYAVSNDEPDKQSRACGSERSPTQGGHVVQGTPLR